MAANKVTIVFALFVLGVAVAQNIRSFDAIVPSDVAPTSESGGSPVTVDGVGPAEASDDDSPSTTDDNEAATDGAPTSDGVRPSISDILGSLAEAIEEVSKNFNEAWEKYVDELRKRLTNRITGNDGADEDDGDDSGSEEDDDEKDDSNNIDDVNNNNEGMRSDS